MDNDKITLVVAFNHDVTPLPTVMITAIPANKTNHRKY
jgi:hypothetical protein